MNRVFSWTAVESDLRVGLVLVADACRYLVGMGDRGDAAAAVILGLEEVPNQHLDDLIRNEEFLNGLKIAETAFESCAKRCFELVTVLKPLEEIDVREEREEGTRWLSYFLSFMPREALGGWDFTGTFQHPDAPLVMLLGRAEARLALAEYVQHLVLRGDRGLGFSPKHIAHLGDVDVRTVRNAMGPKGDKPIQSSAGIGKRADSVVGNPLDSLEWLAARRGFHPGRLSPQWVNSHLSEIQAREIAAALPGVVAWVNRTTTEQLASSIAWSAEDLRAWIRGEKVDRVQASRLAVAAGLDGAAYQALINRVTG